MNSFNTLKTLFCGSLLAFSMVNTTQAGVSLDRTRIVLTGNENLVLSKSIQTDIKSFLEDFRENPPDVKNLKISASIDELAELLDNIFLSRE